MKERERERERPEIEEEGEFLWGEQRLSSCAIFNSHPIPSPPLSLFLVLDLKASGAAGTNILCEVRVGGGW